VPEKYRDQVDVRAFGTGERIVFLPYTREVFTATQDWNQRIFPDLPSPLPTTKPSWRPRQRLAPERIMPCDSAEGPIWRPATRTLKHRPLPLGIHSPGTRCPCTGRRWVRCPCTRPMGMRRLARA